MKNGTISSQRKCHFSYFEIFVNSMLWFQDEITYISLASDAQKRMFYLNDVGDIYLTQDMSHITTTQTETFEVCMLCLFYQMIAQFITDHSIKHL